MGLKFDPTNPRDEELRSLIRKSFVFDNVELSQEIQLVIDYPSFYNLALNETPDSNNCI